MEANKVCIYHGNCADGFMSATIVKYAFDLTGEDVDFVAGVYQTPPPTLKNKKIYFVDFSYKRTVMEKLLKANNSITIIDHHKTAIEDLKDFPFFSFSLDTEHSGAMLTWIYFLPQTPIPEIVKHIEDRDLWLFKLPKTREIQAALFSYPYDFPIWTKFLLDDSCVGRFAKEGEAIERKHFKDIRELLKVCRKPLQIAGHCVMAANLPYTLSSDAGHIMVAEENEIFGCCYYESGSEVIFSLRSDDSSIDVSEIAKIYDGGGHRNAAGFKVSREQFREFETIR